jgi:hypothetical protein
MRRLLIFFAILFFCGSAKTVNAQEVGWSFQSADFSGGNVLVYDMTDRAKTMFGERWTPYAGEDGTICGVTTYWAKHNVGDSPTGSIKVGYQNTPNATTDVGMTVIIDSVIDTSFINAVGYPVAEPIPQGSFTAITTLFPSCVTITTGQTLFIEQLNPTMDLVFGYGEKTSTGKSFRSGYPMTGNTSYQILVITYKTLPVAPSGLPDYSASTTAAILGTAETVWGVFYHGMPVLIIYVISIIIALFFSSWILKKFGR